MSVTVKKMYLLTLLCSTTYLAYDVHELLL